MNQKTQKVLPGVGCDAEWWGFFFSGNDGAPAAAEIPVPVPADHVLRFPGERPCGQPVAALHFTSVADR